MTTCYPLVVPLPDGTQARVRIIHVVETKKNEKGEQVQVLSQLVPSPPQYERRDGTTIEIDVAIPDDLAAAGWYWFGSVLRWPAGDLRGIGILTSCYPPPPIKSERGSCFDCAREFERLRAEGEDRRIQVAVAKATKTKLPKRASKHTANAASESQVRALAQMELF